MIRARSLTALALVAVLASPALASATSLRELRYQRMIGQTTWFTCGPAAVATLLSYYFGLQVSEAEILEVSLEVMGADAAKVETGITALALKTALERYGIPTRGYRVTTSALAQYFQRGGLPLILHVTRPQLHYLVAEGFISGHFVIADPSYGRRLLPSAALEGEKGFSGVVLATLPNPALAERAALAQQETLSWARERLSRLTDLRSRIR